MSFKTFNAKKMAKKGISPVIATVILVAVAVVIAAALAGFSSSLFGTYSSAGAAVTVKSVTMDVDGVGSVTLTNSGNVADALVSVSVVGFTPDDNPDATLSPSGSLSVPPNNGDDMVASFQIGTGTGVFTEGQVVTIKFNLQSGAQITQSVIVTA